MNTRETKWQARVLVPHTHTHIPTYIYIYSLPKKGENEARRKPQREGERKGGDRRVYTYTCTHART